MVELIFKNEVYKIIGACQEVHRILGFGFLEPVYHEALAYEFSLRKIPFIKEARLEVRYKDVVLEKFYIADFICFDNIIVEIKAVENLIDEHISQVINYLSATGFQLGLLVNFGSPSLQFKRIVV